jgi:two-component system sensor histidine kinase QseC
VEGAGPVPTQPLNLRGVVSQFLRQWRSPHFPRVEIENRVEDQDVLADPGAVQIILRNLLENSARHGGRDTVRVELSSRCKNGQVWLTVTDDGHPVGAAGAPRRLGRLFEKGASSKGAGVGLYLVRSLMVRMGGGVEFRPASEGENSRGFQVVLRFLGEVDDG